MPARKEIRLRKIGKNSGLMKPFKISSELKTIIGVPTASRAEVMKLIWRYVIANKLQDPRDKRFFYPDAAMRTVFGDSRMRVHATMKFIKPHLIPPTLNNPMLKDEHADQAAAQSQPEHNAQGLGNVTAHPQ